MKTGKENKPPGNIHRQQLFHWIGCDIDRRNRGRKVLSEELATECLARVAASLESGIWVKVPRIPEQFELRDSRITLNLPIACFTEWSLGQSLPHTAEYGRIGFGFPKRWVIDRGGQSVTYFRHSRQGAFLQSLFRLLASLGHDDGNGTWSARADSPAFADLIYVLHFAKMIRLKKTPSERKPKTPSVNRSTPRKQRSNAAVEMLAFRRKFGAPLQFVEEREWRIVHHPSNPHFAKGPGIPDYLLPYVPGEELFTLVLPDNKVVSRLLERDWFTSRLFTPWMHYPGLKNRHVPPVTVLAHCDIGTY